MAARLFCHLLFLLVAVSFGTGITFRSGRASKHAWTSLVQNEDIEPRHQDCPSGWVGPHRGTCYKLVTDKALNWDGANATGCPSQHEGAHLAAITYDNKAFLSKQSDIRKGSYYWIGLRSPYTKWNQDTEFETDIDYTNWEVIKAQEPDGAAISNDDCVIMSGAGAGTEFQPPGVWADTHCDSTLSYVCETEQEDGACAEGWELLNGRCFRLSSIDDFKSWQAARDACASTVPSSRLAVIDFQLPGDSRVVKDSVAFWVALRSTPGSDGVLRWSSPGKPQVVNTNWQQIVSVEPNGVPERNELCVAVNGVNSMDIYAVGEWADVDCSFKTQYLCEMHP
ncbi:macrophage mannose receptor 1-like [Amphibalanus amphitrite]|uniref:macrophage mannose receptor 1-like n=1 Tax=Amphibalanus amphitrite TaxID=1232801 RepID=UPI001C9278EF|nr:macrophage mannose receptor 1-like [Amphibalanus amphitrite]